MFGLPIDAGTLITGSLIAVAGYVIYIGATKGAPAAWSMVTSWWNKGKADLAALKGDVATTQATTAADIAAIKADIAAIKTKLGA